jgi:hypothetical protein
MLNAFRQGVRAAAAMEDRDFMSCCQQFPHDMRSGERRPADDDYTQIMSPITA